ncbi:hypothetical protein ABE33_11600 [Bacillus safensis]|uniref:hypothetical protein n=1 Tax=Bacillus TaxID=1386 RepID=UPI00090A0C6E|nr:hypothetical protein [Bacillus]APJ10735.1 hypothetical protein BSL056_07100 [Bacillus safensis]MBG9825812.1 hypothetical protein [Bacillus safensis]MBG9835458.1 hypothetical protein [Bacillus safensis]MBG9861659.1 hypothetical protein [Bacillus safensis]MBG9900399.1 hypothetical protein [Bacillus safensis]
MTDKEKQAIFQDLYELYQEGDLGAEAASWMKAHEQQYQHVDADKKQSSASMKGQNDYDELKRMKGFIYSLYFFFIVLSIWMTVWFYF